MYTLWKSTQCHTHRLAKRSMFTRFIHTLWEQQKGICGLFELGVEQIQGFPIARLRAISRAESDSFNLRRAPRHKNARPKLCKLSREANTASAAACAADESQRLCRPFARLRHLPPLFCWSVRRSARPHRWRLAPPFVKLLK